MGSVRPTGAEMGVGIRGRRPCEQVLCLLVAFAVEGVGERSVAGVVRQRGC